ncbi:MAG: glycogen/starch/alpha-glucan phosphorylase [Sphingomonadales bacterium]|nr:glycogen/starch/alpha-glucan phosphorylase [Sphingomonadales bacterium]
MHAIPEEIQAHLAGRRGESLTTSIHRHLVYSVGKDPENSVPRDWCIALSLAVRDRIVDPWMETTRRIYRDDQKRVYYLSMEFLIGRLLRDALSNLGLMAECRLAAETLGIDLNEIFEAEPDAALGNGGLGRLAACFLDSMANVGVAGYGYGIRYEHGLFRQSICDGWQMEEPEDWLTLGHPWEFERAEVVYPIDFGGRVEERADGQRLWRPAQRVLATAYDTPIAGWQARHVNTLRLWSARPAELLDLSSFNAGHYIQAAEQRILAESISQILYPDDSTPQGRELRLKQEMFFTSASIQDLLRRYLRGHTDLAALGDHVAIQLNDTHPAIAVPELMRLLTDEHGLGFDAAFDVTRSAVNYTNHTLLSEALENWPRDMFAHNLPRHLEIIEQIDRRVVAKHVAKAAKVDQAAVSIIDHENGGAVRMGNLAFIGSSHVNGVSALHSELMKETTFRELHRLYPDRIVNQTNGVTPRRWLYECNPALSALITEAIGDAWIGDLDRLSELAPRADDADFRAAFAAAKRANKERLANVLATRCGIGIDPAALLDIQIKRMHEYKRQLLNALETVAHYNAIREAPDKDWQPRVKIFAGKAAPSYMTAKLIIKLINDIAARINADPVVGDRLKVVYIPNYNVSAAELLIPAADLSEQISTAGMEASGTGNMKFALNGALTVGTLDGANIEIRERVGPENIFIFGLTAEEVAAKRKDRSGQEAVIAACPELERAMELVGSGGVSPDEPERFKGLIDGLRHHDHFMVTDDFADYWRVQREIDKAFGNRDDWFRKAVLNTANMGWFSSDRTIRGYAGDIWHALPNGAGPEG